MLRVWNCWYVLIILKDFWGGLKLDWNMLRPRPTKPGACVQSSASIRMTTSRRGALFPTCQFKNAEPQTCYIIQIIYITHISWNYSYLASVQVDLVPCLFWTIPIWHWYQERCWVWCWLLPSLLQENVKEGDKKCTIEDKMPPAGTCHILSCLLLGKSSWCDTRIEPPCVTERTNEWVWILVFVISVCSNLSHTRSDKFVQNQRYGLLISASRFWRRLISIRISGTDAVPSSIFMYFRDWRLNHQTVATLQTNSFFCGFHHF